MLRRLLPCLRRGLVSSAVPPQHLIHRPLASHGGPILPYGSIFKGPIDVLSGCPRLSLFTPTFSSLPPSRGPPRNGRRGFTAKSPSPEPPHNTSSREDPSTSKECEANDVGCAGLIEPQTTEGILSSADGDLFPSPKLTLPTGIDWSKYVHVSEFDCSGQELHTDAVPLKQFVDSNPMTEVRRIYGNKLGKIDPKGNLVKEKDSFVKDTAKKYCKNLIDGMSKFHGADVCVAKLDHSNIVIAADGSVAKYTDLCFVPATLKLKKQNYAWLKKILKEDFFEGKPIRGDMKRLLDIMERHSVASDYLMRRHVALVPQINKSAFFLRLFERFKILQFIDEEVARKILNSLEKHIIDWRELMLLNELLESIFTHGSGYDPVDDPYIFVLCYKHGCYHKLDRACHPVTKKPLFTAVMFEDIQESTFPEVVAQLEEELYKIGLLHHCQLDHLF